mmetsp:Transcript_18375/g.51218  ORF Transcript_18375/g.51218 Transcript_18375/m.51218 type:complete len:89 (+) Transcript_18375:431-697(+)
MSYIIFKDSSRRAGVAGVKDNKMVKSRDRVEINPLRQVHVFGTFIHTDFYKSCQEMVPVHNLASSSVVSHVVRSNSEWWMFFKKITTQ